MSTVPLRAEYRPTLGELLAGPWGRAPKLVRALVVVAGLGLLAAVVGLVLTLEPASISEGGAVPFGFEYKGLYRTAPDPGGYAKVVRRREGRVEDSFAVGPLTLPPYQGELSGELPVYATEYVAGLAREDENFVLRGEGKTRVNTVPGYNIFYTETVEGRTMWGRVILLLPERAGVRRGVAIELLTTPHANPEVKTPLEIATAGVLQAPVHTFTFG